MPLSSIVANLIVAAVLQQPTKQRNSQVTLLQNFKNNGSSKSVGENPMSERDLHNTVEDSFPASNPPSHTPTTGFGEPARIEEGTPSFRQEHRRAIYTSVGVAVLSLVVAVVWAKQSHT